MFSDPGGKGGVRLRCERAPIQAVGDPRSSRITPIQKRQRRDRPYAAAAPSMPNQNPSRTVTMADGSRGCSGGLGVEAYPGQYCSRWYRRQHQPLQPEAQRWTCRTTARRRSARLRWATPGTLGGTQTKGISSRRDVQPPEPHSTTARHVIIHSDPTHPGALVSSTRQSNTVILGGMMLAFGAMPRVSPSHQVRPGRPSSVELTLG